MVVDIKALTEQAAAQEDHSKSPERFEYAQRIPPVGGTIGRFIEYIELGKHPQPDYQGKAKPPAVMVRLTFELLAPKNIIDGPDGKKQADKITITLKKSLDDKAAFKKLFSAMTYGRDIKHMAAMLGEAFVMQVLHNTVGDGDAKRTYANIRDASGIWTIRAPYNDDPLTGERKAYAVPKALSDLKIFLWNIPTLETWNSLFVEGTRKIKGKDGTDIEETKNWLQEKILSATDFSGSPLSALLAGIDDLPTTEHGPTAGGTHQDNTDDPLADLDML